MNKQSVATRRASGYPAGQSEWYCGFSYTPVTGIGYEEGAHRRDPSSVIQVGDLYYVYYTKSAGPHFGRSQIGNPRSKLFPWDYADIFCATSKDGVNWVEQGPAVERGTAGSFDARTCCTPDVLAHDGRYYLVYQTQADDSDYTGRNENVGMVIASSPDEPWEKVDRTILEPMEPGEWFGDQNSYNSGAFNGVTHDPSLYFYRGKFWLYYKCGYGTADLESDRGHKYAGPDTRWGVATSADPEGPYTHSELNPVTNSGHETMLWHYQGGIAALLNRDGPEKDTIQWAPDGLNFEIMSHVVSDTPQAGGAFRSPFGESHPLEGIRWGLCHVDERGSLWNHILRFDCDPRFSYAQAYGAPQANTQSIF